MEDEVYVIYLFSLLFFYCTDESNTIHLKVLFNSSEPHTVATHDVPIFKTKYILEEMSLNYIHSECMSSVLIEVEL